MAGHEVVVIAVEGTTYGVAAQAVRRIVPMVHVTPLPNAPQVVEGMIDLHGDIVPVVDVRLRLGHAPRTPRADDRLVIARAAGRTVALHVDRAVTLIDAGEIEPLEDADQMRHLAGVGRTGDGLLVVTDIDAFLSQDEEAALAAALEAAVTP